MSYGGGYGGAGAYPPPTGGPPGPPGGSPYGSPYPPQGGGYGAPGVIPPATGGFAAGGYNAPPPGSDPQLYQWFSAVDTDRSGSITAEELQRALINGDWTPFDLDTVKFLMSVFDTNRSGTINFNEFAGLWKYVKDWQGVFRHFDQDRSGGIDHNEMTQALRQFGYNLPPKLTDLLVKKYLPAPLNPKQRHGMGPPPAISFDRFVRACVVVKTLTEKFQQRDAQRTGWVQINYEDFMEIVLSSP